jgi:hypothetical protein
MRPDKTSLKYVIDVIEQEGFDYAFAHYDDFDEVKSQEFQTLKNKYNAARKDLVEFLGVDE